ncbi:MAG: hypothetical protein ACQEWV_03215 [Bacillota bacterium]
MKWKNYGLWVSIASVLYLVFKDLGLQIYLTQWDTYVTAILGILVILGVISNPENGKGFFNAKTPPSSTEIAPTTQPDLSTDSPYVLNELNRLTDQAVNQTQNPPNNPNQLVHSSDTQTTQEIVPDRRYPPYEK